eukprot:Gb_19902 [translate_table: standard]
MLERGSLWLFTSCDLSLLVSLQLSSFGATSPINDCLTSDGLSTSSDHSPSHNLQLLVTLHLPNDNTTSNGLSAVGDLSPFPEKARPQATLIGLQQSSCDSCMCPCSSLGLMLKNKSP